MSDGRANRTACRVAPGAGTAIAHVEVAIRTDAAEEKDRAKTIFGRENNTRGRPSVERVVKQKDEMGCERSRCNHMCGERMTSPYGSRHYS